MDLNLHHRTAIVTGGATGLGKEFVLSLAREGVNICFTYMHEDEHPELLVETVKSTTNVEIVAVKTDLSDEQSRENLFATCIDRLGNADILVNNAGRQQYCESLEELTTADFDATFKTNVYAAFWITKAALRHLKEHSAIINTSSVQAFKPSPILLDYAQTKACLVAFTKSLAKQLGPKGIRVNAVAPGPYWTVLQSSGGQPQEKVQQFGEDTPLGRPGQPVEIAPLYVLLASDACSYASGQVWCSDGGTGVA